MAEKTLVKGKNGSLQVIWGYVLPGAIITRLGILFTSGGPFLIYSYLLRDIFPQKCGFMKLNGKSELRTERQSAGLNGRRGFTLVELLVVIAIIALLMAILMPALQLARRRAQGIYCRANMRSLSIAWTIYAQENDEKIVSGEVWGNYGNVKPFDWVHPLISTSDPLYVPGMSDHARELAGIRKGALFPYTKTEKIYNCPGDKTWKQVTGPLSIFQSPYRSFAASWAMNGQWGGIDPKYKYKSTVNIIRPSMRLVFLEEEDDGGANWGSWILHPDPAKRQWWDPIAVWHSGRSTNLGFADGHSEAHFWKDKSTIEMGEDQKSQKPLYPGEVEDLAFMKRAFHQDFK